MTTTKITTRQGPYIIETFTGAGTYNWTVPNNRLLVDVLVIAGGGGGGCQAGGGGGGGGFLERRLTLIGSTITITVGAGGAGSSTGGVKGTTGGNSSIGGILVALGGGGGGSVSNTAGANGGCGGGARSNSSTNGGAGSQGYDGGDAPSGTVGAGGGGGAGEIGADGTATYQGGDGGDGLVSSISGAPTRYSSGGGGGDNAANGGGAGGSSSGGGLAGSGVRNTGTAGEANLGCGGGGGGDNYAGGAGSGGIVIIRYPVSIGLEFPDYAWLFAGESPYIQTNLQGKTGILIHTDLAGKTTLQTQTDLQGKCVGATTTELRGKTSVLYVYNLSSLIKSGRVIADVTSKMIEGTFEFDGVTVGGVFSGNYWEHVEFHIPDYAAVQQPVFVGFFPSSSAKYRDAAENEILKGYGFEWYLTMNPLNDSDLVLLTPDHQEDITYYQLQFDFQEHYFQPGNKVVGGTTGDIGLVTEVIYGVFDSIIMTGVEYGPGRSAGDFFQDDEQLLIGGILFAYADGHAVDYTGSAATINPEDWLERVLGGDDWNVLYGLEPYRIASTSTIWDGTKPAVDFVFRDEQSIIEAIEDPTKYLEFIFFPSWRNVSGYQQPCVYWIPGEDIDDPSEGLDLPDPVTITSPDPYLVSIDLDQKGEGSYNRVIVRCRLLNGSWYTKTITSSGVDTKEERVRTYRETNKNIATSAECDTRCQDLYDYLNMQVITWKVVFLLRSDFRRLQKLTFSGYGAKLPNDTYRILRIEYDYGEGGTINSQTCTIIRDSAFLTYMSLNRSFTETIREMQAISKAEVDKIELAEIGEIVSVDGSGNAIYLSEQGLTKPGIDADPS